MLHLPFPANRGKKHVTVGARFNFAWQNAQKKLCELNNITLWRVVSDNHANYLGGVELVKVKLSGLYCIQQACPSGTSSYK